MPASSNLVCWIAAGLVALSPLPFASVDPLPAAILEIAVLVAALIWVLGRRASGLGALPARDPRAAVGGASGAQQAEELRQLRQLAARPEGPPARAPSPTTTVAGGSAAPAATDPADKLAAWLLAQVDLSDLG